MKTLLVIFLFLTGELLAGDLVTPPMEASAPAAGKRVRQVAPEYEGTEVYHSLYLPTDWVEGKRFPVLVEYTGNKFPPGKGSGEVRDANLGYGISGGEGYIWIVMPYVELGFSKSLKVPTFTCTQIFGCTGKVVSGKRPERGSRQCDREKRIVWLRSKSSSNPLRANHETDCNVASTRYQF